MSVPAAPSTARVTVVGLLSLAVAMGIGRFVMTPLLPMMRDDGSLAVVEAGWLAAAHFLGYWLGAVTVAWPAMAPRGQLRAALLAVAVATLGMGLTDDFHAWLVLRGLAGVASAWVLILVGNHAVGYLAAVGRPMRRGWVFAGVGFGIMLAGLGCLALMWGGIASARAWQVIGGVTGIAAAVLCLVLGPEYPAARPAMARRGTRRRPLDWRLVVAYGAMGTGYIVPATYLPLMAQAAAPAPLVFGWAWPVFGAAAMVSTVLAQRLLRHMAGRRLWAFCQVVMAAGCLMPAVWPGFMALIAGGLAVGGSFMVITMASMTEAHRMAPPGDVGRHVAMLTAAFATGQMIGPPAAGWLHELTGGFQVSLLATGVLLVLTAGLLLVGEAPLQQSDGTQRQRRQHQAGGGRPDHQVERTGHLQQPAGESRVEGGAEEIEGVE